MNTKKNTEQHYLDFHGVRFAMSAKKNTEQPSDAVRELLAEALAYGIFLQLEVHPNGIPSSTQASKQAAELPKRAQEIINELLSKHYLKLCEAVNAKRRADGQKPIGDDAKLAQRQEDFEKAYYGKLRKSEKGRKAVDLLRAWRGGQIIEQLGWCRREDCERVALLTPFLDAVRDLDVEFFRLLAQAAQMLDVRVESCKDKSIGTGDTSLNIWLLEYGFRIAGTPTHTVRELKEQFVSKFRSISVDKLRERCNRLGVPLKAAQRGPKTKAIGKKA